MISAGNRRIRTALTAFALFVFSALSFAQVAVVRTPVDPKYTLLGPTAGTLGDLLVPARNLQAGYSAPPALFIFGPDGTLKAMHEMDPGYDILAKPAQDANGTIYVPLSVRYPDGLRYPSVVALNADATLKWSLRLDDPYYVLDNDVLLGADGTVFIAADTAVGGSLHNAALVAVRPDGSAKWTSPISYRYRLTVPVASNSGLIYLPVYNPRDDEAHPSRLLIFQDTGAAAIVQEQPLGRTALPLGPVTGADGSIYIAVENRYAGSASSLIALNPDGSPKWTVDLDPQFDVQAKPGIGPDGSVYLGLSIRIPDAQKQPCLLALGADSAEKWRLPFDPWYLLNQDVQVDSAGTVYVAANNSMGGEGHRPLTLAVDPRGNPLWKVFTPYLNYQLTAPTTTSVAGSLYNSENNPYQGMTTPSRFVFYR